jgi:cytochrome o ubiquinol oxidase operon protein cyoD
MGGHSDRRLSHGSRIVSNDVAPGDAEQHDVASSVRSYLIGLFLAGGLTAASFWTLRTPYLWSPGVGVALAALAIAQMGVHLVFFLKITTGPDNTNNVLALAFGVLIVTLLVGGSLWIMANLDRHHDMGTGGRTHPANQTSSETLGRPPLGGGE